MAVSIALPARLGLATNLLICNAFGACIAGLKQGCCVTRFGVRRTVEPEAGRFARAAHSAVRLNNGRVFLYGGFTNDNTPAPGELFDPDYRTLKSSSAEIMR
jgi:hypothetical protein